MSESVDIARLTARELIRALRRRELSCREAVEAVFARVDEVEPLVRAYVTLTRETAMAEARALDAMLARGEDPGPLAGVPVAVKDIICTRGVRTTCASKILHNFIPPYDATVTERLRAAGAVVVGKTNMDEFAMGSSTENSAFFTTRNPWDLDRVPGGSSGGSAAAVAADEAFLALGSDTGGSVRQPAAFCGVTGLKPTYGRVSRYGLVAFASSLDQIGPITKDVSDCALLLGVVAGHDPRDSTSVPHPVPDYLAALEPAGRLVTRDGEPIRIGVPREYMGEGVGGLASGVRDAVMAALKALEATGARVVDVSLPHTEYALAAYYLIATAEASSNLARYDGTRYGLRVPGARDCVSMTRQTRSRGFGPEVRRRIMLGTYALSSGYYDAYYLKALKVRTLLCRDFARAMEECDVIAGPTSPTVAFRVGEKTGDPLEMYLSDVYTITANLVGCPAISVPCGLGEHGMPVGLQIMGRPLDEVTVLRVARAYETAAGPLDRRGLPRVAGTARVGGGTIG